MKNSDITHPLFREAVEAIDTGDINTLKRLLDGHPQLVAQRLNIPEEGYFQHPYLLWFIADNPIRHEKLPANIVEITRLIMDKVREHAPETFLQQISYACGLVSTGRIPGECGVQIELMNMFLDAGVKPGSGLGELAHGNIEAAKHLIKRGAELTLPVAVGLGWNDDIMRLAKTATGTEMQVALVVAGFFGNAGIISFLIEKGVDVNAVPDNFYGFHSHASALHQAVYSGSVESVQLLVEAGAKLDATDRIYDGTPLDWAMYMQTEEGYDEEGKRKFAVIETYLKEKKKDVERR
ncbi:MAG TPA: ankyrin repeat domain-containing protein [Chitinophagaceae bacterium]|jgi:peptide-methionine (S)-S-oxide reductase